MTLLQVAVLDILTSAYWSLSWKILKIRFFEDHSTIMWCKSQANIANYFAKYLLKICWHGCRVEVNGKEYILELKESVNAD